MTVADFLAEVGKYRKKNPALRQGQSMWNLAFEQWGLAMDSFVGSRTCDPYYSLDTETDFHDRFLSELVKVGLLVK